MISMDTVNQDLYLHFCNDASYVTNWTPNFEVVNPNIIFEEFNMRSLNIDKTRKIKYKLESTCIIIVKENGLVKFLCKKQHNCLLKNAHVIAGGNPVGIWENTHLAYSAVPI